MLEDFWEQYETFSENVMNSTLRLFANNLARWLELLEGEPLIAPLMQRLGSSFDFVSWYQTEEKEKTRVGNASLDFPRDTEGRLGAHLYVLREMGTNSRRAVDFAHKFLSNDTNFENLIQHFIAGIFRPLQSELRKYLEKQTRNTESPAASRQEVPASDRTVSLDHNSRVYVEAIEALNRVRDAVAKSNEYDDKDDQEQRLAELDASRVLLGAHRARVSAVRDLTVRCLRYLGGKFVEGAIGAAVGIAITALAALFGIHLFG